jgi:hypothetical protein
MDAAVQRLQQAIVSGEATAYMVDTGSGAVSAYGNADTTISIFSDLLAQNANALARDSLAAAFGALAGLYALPAVHYC